MILLKLLKKTFEWTNRTRFMELWLTTGFQFHKFQRRFKRCASTRRKDLTSNKYGVSAGSPSDLGSWAVRHFSGLPNSLWRSRFMRLFPLLRSLAFGGRSVVGVQCLWRRCCWQPEVGVLSSWVGCCRLGFGVARWESGLQVMGWLRWWESGFFCGWMICGGWFGWCCEVWRPGLGSYAAGDALIVFGICDIRWVHSSLWCFMVAAAMESGFQIFALGFGCVLGFNCSVFPWAFRPF